MQKGENKLEDKKLPQIVTENSTPGENSANNIVANSYNITINAGGLSGEEAKLRVDAAKRFCSNPFEVKQEDVEELINIDYYES